MKKIAFFLFVLALSSLQTLTAAERLGYVTVRVYNSQYYNQYYSAQALIDDNARTVKLGSGFNACVPQYLTGSLTVPGSFVINGLTYRLKALSPLCFRLCSGLTSITIGDGLESVGSFAFVGCKGLQTLTLPMTLKRFESGALAGCNSTATININATDPPAWLADDVLTFEGFDYYGMADHLIKVSPVSVLDYFDYEYDGWYVYIENAGYVSLQYSLPRHTLYSTSEPRLLDEGQIALVVDGIEEVDGVMTVILRPLGSDIIPANTGVVIFNPEDYPYLIATPYDEDEEEYDAPRRARAPEEEEVNLLEASTEVGTLVATGSQYVLADDGSGNFEFSRVDEDTLLPAHSAWLEAGDATLPETMPILYRVDGQVTAVDRIDVAKAKTDGPVFDLQGRRLSRRPDRGIYIQNGEKQLAR